jgi:hypothetical protein
MEAEFDVKKYKELVKDKGLTQIKLVQKFNENGHNIKLETIKSWTKKITLLDQHLKIYLF